MKQRDTFSIQRLALVGMMAAMVFALTYVGSIFPQAWERPRSTLAM